MDGSGHCPDPARVSIGLVGGRHGFSLTQNFDRWTDDGVSFVFGFDARSNLVDITVGGWERSGLRDRVISVARLVTKGIELSS